MICKNCGYEMNKQTKFCTKCGAAMEAFAQEVPQAAEVDFVVENAEQPKAPKKGKAPLWIALSAVAVALVVAIVLNLSAIGNFFQKTFSSDEEYFKQVMQQDSDFLAENIAAMFSVESVSLQSAGRGTISFQLGDSLISLLETNANGTSFDWLSKGEVSFDFAMKDNTSAAKMIAKLNGKEIVSMEAIYDLMKQTMFFRYPELSQQFLYGTMNDLNNLGSYDAEDDYYDDMPSADAGFDSYMDPTALTESMQKIVDALPDEETTASLIKRYLDLVYDNLGEVEKEDKTVKVNGVSQNATKYTVEIDDKVVCDILEAILKEAKDDKDLEQIIKNVAEVAEADPQEAYEGFQESMEGALDNLDENKPEFDESVEYSIWVDGNGKIIGRVLEGEEFSLSCLEPTSGNQYALELEFSADGQTISFNGNGTVSGDKKTGEYTLEMMGLDLVKFEIKDFSTENGLNGTVEMSLASGIISLAGDSLTAEQAQLLDAKLKMDFETTKEKLSAKVSVLTKSELLASVGISMEIIEGYTFEMPSQEGAVNMADEYAMENWAASIDLNKLLSNLREAGVPEELLSSSTVDSQW